MNSAVKSPSKPKVIRFPADNVENFFSIYFRPAPVRIDEETWPTAAHYFHAQKFESDDVRRQIKETPDLQKFLKQIRRTSSTVRDDWTQIRDKVMEKCNRAKFDQHPDLRANLLETNGIRLVAEDPNDSYFGDGLDGRGENRLGILLAQLRDSLIAQSQTTKRTSDTIQNLQKENGDTPVIQVDVGATIPPKRRKQEIYKQMMEILDNALERIETLATELNDGKTDNDEMYEGLQLLLGSVFPRTGSDPFLFKPDDQRK